jgi:hypothetical protein
VWFPGVHSDVGGGYPETGLSDIALQWMFEKALSCNLSFDNITTKPDPTAKLHETYTGFYKLQSKLYRPIGKSEPKDGNTNESLHPSVMERYKKDSTYRPKNLVEYFNQHTW